MITQNEIVLPVRWLKKIGIAFACCAAIMLLAYILALKAYKELL